MAIQYVSFRIHKDTHKELRKLRTKLKADSMDALINYLVVCHEIIKKQNETRITLWHLPGCHLDSGYLPASGNRRWDIHSILNVTPMSNITIIDPYRMIKWTVGKEEPITEEDLGKLELPPAIKSFINFNRIDVWTSPMTAKRGTILRPG